MSVKQANLPDSLIGPCLAPRMGHTQLQKAGLIILSSHQFNSSALASGRRGEVLPTVLGQVQLRPNSKDFPHYPIQDFIC